MKNKDVQEISKMTIQYEKEIIKPQSAKASYDYYKTYRTGVSGAYGATGYSKPSVTVSSWSANKMKFKGT